jgi:hypothetical protein
MVQSPDKSNRLVLAMLAILGASLAVFGWYNFLS